MITPTGVLRFSELVILLDKLDTDNVLTMARVTKYPNQDWIIQNRLTGKSITLVVDDFNCAVYYETGGRKWNAYVYSSIRVGEDIVKHLKGELAHISPAHDEEI